MSPLGTQFPRRVGLALLALALVFALVPRAQATQVTPCEGDETMTSLPLEPLVGEPVYIDVTSRRAYPGVSLGGPIVPQAMVEGDGPAGHTWRFFLVADQPGTHEFAFLIDGGEVCATVAIVVGDGPPAGETAAAASPAAAQQPLHPQTLFEPLIQPDFPVGFVPRAAAPAAAEGPRDGSAAGATPTPRSARIVARAASGSASANENEDLGDSADPTPTRQPTSTRQPTATREPTPTRTPTPLPTRTPTPETPQIDSTDPGSVLCGQPLTIRGHGFGASRSAVDGRVRVTGLEASISRWTSTEISISAPNGLRSQPEGSIEVSTAGGSDTRGMRISC